MPPRAGLATLLCFGGPWVVLALLAAGGWLRLFTRYRRLGAAVLLLALGVTVALLAYGWAILQAVR